MSLRYARSIRDARCAVASDSASEATLVRSLLEREFTEIFTVATDEEREFLFDQDDVPVLLLAFSAVALAVEFHDRYLSERRAGGIAAQAVLLCAREEVEQAYELCRMHRVFDYVMFWPVTHDPRRLPLAAHRACDAHALLAAVGGGAPATAPEAVAAPEPPRLHDGMVLVVEDDDFQLELALSVLRSANVAAAGINGGAAALAALATGTPGLILLDVDMPDVNGLELLRRLNATQPGIAVPVIMLTAVRDRSQVLEALREGAIDYIAKPYDRDTLLYKVQRVLGRPRASPRPAMY